jgi:hypothetical protein
VIACDDEDAPDELVSHLATDALTLLASIDVDPLTDSQQQTVALLALVAGRTWNRQADQTGQTAGGGSPRESPRTGLSRPLTPTLATRTQAGRSCRTM